MTVKANWGLGALDLPESDPMAAIAQLQSVGRVIDLSRGSAELLDELKDTMRQEGRFETNLALSCPDKWTVEDGGELSRNPCRTCPHRTTDPADPMTLLCALGMKQETILDSYFAACSREALDASLISAVEADLDAAHELAEAVL